MESSKRRQAIEWLRRNDLVPEERRQLEEFARRYPADPTLTPTERRALLELHDRLCRRFAAGARDLAGRGARHRDAPEQAGSDERAGGPRAEA